MSKPALTPPPGPPPSPRIASGAGTRLYVAVFVALLLAGAVAVAFLLPAQMVTDAAQSSAARGAAAPAQPPPTAGQAETTVSAREASPLPGAPPVSVENDTAIAATVARSGRAPGDAAADSTGSPSPAREQRGDAARATSTEPALDARRARAAAELALREAVAVQVSLENAGVEEWGEELLQTSYPLAKAELAAADTLMSAERFDEAEVRYREAARLLRLLQDNAPRRLQQSLERGRESLLTEAAQSAPGDFTRALAIDPTSPEARAGLERARQRPRALAELEHGRMLEAQGDLPGAEQAYKAALLVEPEFEAARSAAEQVAARILRAAFDKATAQAVSALDAGRFDEAGKALAEARKLDPGSKLVSTLAQRLAAAKQQALLRRLRTKAAALEEDEQWADAVALYDEALAVDPTVAFAVNGRERAGSFAELHAQMERYLAAPERLNSPDPLARAQKVLDAANRVQPAGPRLERERSRLAGLIEAAQQPVAVVVSSDGRTQVTIQRIARLGAIEEHTLQLKPGTYVAVGTRPGYRDVRVVLEVPPGSARMLVDVRCKEPI